MDITQTSHAINSATWEVIIMLTVSFILGMLFHRLLIISGRYEPQVKTSSKTPTDTVDVIALEAPHQFAGFSETDLQIIEGIGPKIEKVLKDAQIQSWEDLAKESPKNIKTILMAAGDMYHMHDPSSWPDQAALAVERKWATLEEYQELLIGGRTHPFSAQ